jgi:hypothetical protein
MMSEALEVSDHPAGAMMSIVENLIARVRMRSSWHAVFSRLMPEDEGDHGLLFG